MAKKKLLDKIKKLFPNNDIENLKVGDIIVENGYAVMTHDTLAYLIALAQEKGSLDL